MLNSNSLLGVTPTKERRRQNGGVKSQVIERDGDGKPTLLRYRAVYEHPLDVYRKHNIISRQQYRAGLRFKKAYYGSVMARRYDFRPVSETHPLMERTMSDHIIEEAYAVLPVEEMRAILDICGHDLPVSNIKYLEKLRKGLGKLALEWNMAAIGVCEHKKAE